MNNRFFYILQFFAVMLFQVLVLNDIVIKGSVSLFGIPAFIPMIYPILLLMLPVNVNYFVSLGYALFIGLILDYFSSTPGLHIASLVLLSYLRPRILRLFYQYELKKVGSVKPTMTRLDFAPFVFYIGISILIHHFFYYTLQVWSFKNIPLVLMKTVLSALMSVFILLIAQFIFYSKRKIKK